MTHRYYGHLWPFAIFQLLFTRIQSCLFLFCYFCLKYQCILIAYTGRQTLIRLGDTTQYVKCGIRPTWN